MLLNFFKIKKTIKPPPIISFSLGHKVGWNAIAVAVGSASRLLAGIIVVRQLGPDLNGQFAYFLWITETIVLLFNFGLPGAFNRFLAINCGRADSNKALNMLRSGIWIGAVLSFIAAISTYEIAKNFLAQATFQTNNLPILLALLVAAQLWSGLAQTLLTGMQQFRAYTKVVIVSSIMLLVGQSIGAIWWSLTGAIYGTLTSYAVATVLYLWVVLGMQPQNLLVNRSVFFNRQFVVYARDVWLAALISSIVWGRAEIFFLEWLSSSREVGFFAVGLIFSSLVVQIVNLVSSALLPHMSFLVGEGHINRLQNDYRRLTIFIALFVFPIALGGLALMPEIIPLIFGLPYKEATSVAQWLMAASLLSFATVGSSIVYSQGDAKIIRNWSIFGGIGLTTLCIGLIPFYGAVGAGIARLIVQATLIVIGFYLLYSRYRITVPGIPLALLLVAASCCGLAAYAAASIFSEGFMGLILGIICGAIAYIFTLRVLRVIATEDAAALRNLLTKLPSMVKTPVYTIIDLACQK